MITLLLILTVINTICLAVILISKFKEKFVIVDLDTYSTLLDYWADHHDDEGNELDQELAGGVGTPAGFFREALYDDEEEEQEDE